MIVAAARPMAGPSRRKGGVFGEIRTHGPRIRNRLLAAVTFRHPSTIVFEIKWLAGIVSLVIAMHPHNAPFRMSPRATSSRWLGGNPKLVARVRRGGNRDLAVSPYH
ncbi:hypothetical protein GCM10011320_10550 [Neoroseomonas lacus]|uniref:Uncharacterized protein n=1 Tax=Neoroseomonas lacus TaxID=287609 RepID=A0A917K8Y4_9PROT|nr:hypothetical protein GCM10011320_10550 [Neoroseomonas lacus]